MSKKATIVLVTVAIAVGVVLGGISRLSGVDFSPLLIAGAPIAVLVIGGAVGTAANKGKKK